jgi:hypothetical protein
MRCGTAKVSNRNTLDCFVGALVFAGSVQHHGVRIGFRCLIEPDVGFPDGEMWDEFRSLE